jgi:hypothetical protein
VSRTSVEHEVLDDEYVREVLRRHHVRAEDLRCDWRAEKFLQPGAALEVVPQNSMVPVYPSLVTSADSEKGSPDFMG